jgi:AraC family transcriptional regulator
MSDIAQGRESSGYGRGLANNFGLDEAPVVISRTLQRPEFAATELLVRQPSPELSDPPKWEDAYTVCVMLQDLPGKRYWEEGVEVGLYDLHAGETVFSDLRREPQVQTQSTIHTLLMYLPRATMNALAEQANLPRVDNLSFPCGSGFRDDVIRGLGLSLLPALRAPEQSNRLFTDHVGMALATHAARVYGVQEVLRPVRGGLAPWQERRAKDMILGDLAGAISLAELAATCGLSADHFARSFRKTTGVAPHAWLLEARVNHAMTLLRRRDFSMAEIAEACGFANPSHFARVFTRRTGVNPSVWRRLELH